MLAAHALRSPRRALGVAAGLVILVAAPAARAQFVEKDVVVLYTLEGQTPDETFGWAVADVPDIDADGVTDFLVGAPFHGDGGTNVGRALLYSGATGAMKYELLGEAPGDRLGYAMAAIDDVNDDGVGDFAVSAPFAQGALGTVYVHSGADGSLLQLLTGEAPGDRFGISVGNAGDVNGDGHGDVVIGAPLNATMGAAGGRAYIVSAVDGALLRTIEAESDGDLLGSGAAFAGDINGDGVPDQIIGARDAGPGQEGRAYVVSGVDGSLLLPPLAPEASGVDLGWFFVATIGDADGDGIPDLYVGDFDDNALGEASGKAYVFSGTDGSTLHVFSGSGAMEGMGPGRGAGDVNGDGRADIVACSWTSSEGADSAGKLHLFSGADGALLRTITSTTEGETLGFDAVGLGDVNGDGIPDLLAAAGSASRVYVISGKPGAGGEGGAGGAGTGAGGAGGDPAGAGGTGGQPAEDPGSSNGCGCRTAPAKGGAGAALAIALASAAAWRRGRRTPRR